MPTNEEKILDELTEIKKLLILQLLQQGVQASSIAELIGLDQADFSRMFPVRKLFRRK